MFNGAMINLSFVTIDYDLQQHNEITSLKNGALQIIFWPYSKNYTTLNFHT